MENTDNGIEEIFNTHLDSLYYEGYANALMQEHSGKYRAELKQFQQQYSFSTATVLLQQNQRNGMNQKRKR